MQTAASRWIDIGAVVLDGPARCVPPPLWLATSAQLHRVESANKLTMVVWLQDMDDAEEAKQAAAATWAALKRSTKCGPRRTVSALSGTKISSALRINKAAAAAITATGSGCRTYMHSPGATGHAISHQLQQSGQQHQQPWTAQYQVTHMLIDCSAACSCPQLRRLWHICQVSS